MKKFNPLLLIVVIVAAAAAYFVFRPKNPPPAAAAVGKTEQATKFVVGYPRLRIALPIFVAKEKGFFDQQGLTVELRAYDTAQPMMDALVAGNIDVAGYCALPITFSSMARSKNQVIFLTAIIEDDQHPISMLIAGKDSGIASVKDLAGKRVGILPTRAYEVWLRQVAKAAGIDADSVIIHQVPPPQQAAALSSGSVQALFTNDPAATAAIKKGAGTLINQTSLVPAAVGQTPLYFGSFNVSKNFATSNPETVRKLSAALDAAIDFIRANPADARAAMKPYLPAEQAGLVDAFPDTGFQKTAEVPGGSLQQQHDYCVKNGVLSAPLADIEALQYRAAP